MKISVNWLKKFANFGDINECELEEKIGARLVEIESVENLGEKYHDVVLARVVSCVPHPDSDHMHLLKIDDDGAADKIISRNLEKIAQIEGKSLEKTAKKYLGAEKLPRDENGYIQVVCGAPNIRENLIVAWLPPTSTVPDSYGTDDEFRLDARKLRGVLSYGMCASPRELGLYDEHDGILEVAEITDEDSRNSIENQLKNTQNLFAKAFEFDDDFLLEVENKSLTDRPDTFGILGFARETAAIFGQKSVSPDWFNAENEHTQTGDFSLEKPNVVIEDPELCARYEGVVISGADGKLESSLLRKTYLARSGVRPLSAIVDISNYLMLLTGQPLHTFDYDKLREISPTGRADIIVRAAEKGEKLELLDGREIEMEPKDIVIAAGDRENSVAVALAGAMGGASTEIDENTKNIFVESATFNLYNLRGTQFRHGIFSEAITRFTKGQPAELTDHVLRQAIAEFAKICGKQISPIADNFAKKSPNKPIKISAEKVNDLLGASYSQEEISQVLENLGYEIREISQDVVAPWWRTDVHIFEDVAEDVGRVLGFDNIPVELPTRKFVAVANPELYNLQRKIREILKSFGANELLTYSFISRKLAENLGLDHEEMYKIVNAISPELQLIRSTLVAKMSEKAVENIRAGYTKIAMFEMGQTFTKNSGMTEENVPEFTNCLAMVVADKNNKSGDAFYLAKKYLTDLFDKFGVEKHVEFREFEKVKNPYEIKRSAEIFAKIEDQKFVKIGEIGELKDEFRENLKLPKFSSAFEISLDEFKKIIEKNSVNYRPVPKFQGTSRDMTFRVGRDVNFAEIENEIRENLENLPENFQTNLVAKDVFAQDETTKNLTFHAEFYDLEKTVDTKYVGKIVDKIAKDLSVKFDAKMI